MTNNTAISNLQEELIYYKPKELIAFYRGVSTPNTDTLIATFARYRYEATEMHQVCKALGIADQDYRKIRNAANRAENAAKGGNKIRFTLKQSARYGYRLPEHHWLTIGAAGRKEVA